MAFLKLATAVLAAAGLLSDSLYAAEPSTARPEYEVKAAFLVNFTKFVEWPTSAFEGPDSPLSICILGDDPFGRTLDQLVDGESVGGRKLVVQRIHRPPKPRTCQVLFISAASKSFEETLPALGPGVLTVGEHDAFLRQGGIISFVIDRDHVRFDINRRAAASASLALNARLLNVARFVQK